MNFKKITTLLLAGVLCAQTMQGNTVEFIENPYLEQAPQEIVELTEKVAALVDYTKPYEVAVPKKAGFQANPWNALMYAQQNTQTMLPVIVANPSWLKSLPEEQQTFLVARCFTQLTMGAQPWYILYAGSLYIAFGLLLTLLFFFLLRKKSPLKTQKVWVSVVAAMLLTHVVDYAFMENAFESIKKNLTHRYGVHLIEATLAKTGDRDAAVQALMAIDAVTKEGAKNGEQVFIPHVELYERLANAVREPQA